MILENELAQLFLSNPRKVAGHTLVTPKRHVEQPWHLSREEQQAIFELVFMAQKKLSDGFSEGVDMRQHYRPFMKQSNLKVDHLHFHVIPRNDQDDIFEEVEQFETPLFVPLTDSERTELTNLFQADVSKEE